MPQILFRLAVLGLLWTISNRLLAQQQFFEAGDFLLESNQCGQMATNCNTRRIIERVRAFLQRE
ncbi:hypothetical protein [Rhodoflexus sp.]